MVKPYFDNVVRNKPRHNLKLFHDAFKLLSDGCVHYVSFRESNMVNVYKLYIFDDSNKYECETICTFSDYRMILKMIPTVYRYSEMLPF